MLSTNPPTAESVGTALFLSVSISQDHETPLICRIASLVHVASDERRGRRRANRFMHASDYYSVTATCPTVLA